MQRYICKGESFNVISINMYRVVLLTKLGKKMETLNRKRRNYSTRNSIFNRERSLYQKTYFVQQIIGEYKS